MSTAEQTALKAVVQLNKDSLEKVLTLSWLIIAAKLEDNFVTFVQKRRGGLQVNGRYKEISLSSVILLHKHHPSLGNIKSHDSHPAYATIGCIRLKKFHEFIDKGANILLRTLYSMAHPQSKWIDSFVNTNSYFNLKEDVRSKLQLKINDLPFTIQHSGGPPTRAPPARRPHRHPIPKPPAPRRTRRPGHGSGVERAAPACVSSSRT